MNILIYIIAMVFAIIGLFTNDIAPVLAGLIMACIATLIERTYK
jgi:hypothetical protein